MPVPAASAIGIMVSPNIMATLPRLHFANAANLSSNRMQRLEYDMFESPSIPSASLRDRRRKAPAFQKAGYATVSESHKKTETINADEKFVKGCIGC
jgi:hypothetical protein